MLLLLQPQALLQREQPQQRVHPRRLSGGRSLFVLLLLHVHVVVTATCSRNHPNSPSVVSLLGGDQSGHSRKRILPSFLFQKQHQKQPKGQTARSDHGDVLVDAETTTTRQRRLPSWRRLDVNLLLTLRGGARQEEAHVLSSLLSSTLLSLSLDEEEHSGSLVSSMLQSAIQSLLNAIQHVSPSVESVLRSLLETVENVLGIQLLTPPPPPVVKLKSSKKKHKSNKVTAGSSKTKKKTKTTSSSSKNDAVADSAAITTSAKTSTNKHKKAGTSSGSSKDGDKTKKTTATTSAHLKKPLATSSPNYRIQRELQAFLKDPPPNLSVRVGSKNIRVWIVTMHGAPNTIYNGETFQLRIAFPAQYPTVPPSVYFLPPHIPLHEHVYTNGDICLSLLGSDWRPTMTAQSIAVSILSILSSAQRKELPMDNARHAQNKPGQYQQDWVYHDDNC
jgi:ubiquitin-conjugating enzyme E2 W